VIFLGMASWHTASVHTMHSVSALLVGSKESIHCELNEGDGLISRSRSTLATKMLTHFPEADVMGMVDTDIQFEPADFLKVVRSARETGQIVAGVYVTRERKPKPTSLPFPGQQWHFVDQDEPSLVEVCYVSPGFMAVPRKILADMTTGEFQTIDGTEVLHFSRGGSDERHAYDFFRTMVIRDDEGEPWWLGEDFSFCERAKQLGYRCLIDQSIFLGHRASVSVGVMDLEYPGHSLTEEATPSYEAIGLTKGART
jgi:hypothetical protein